MLTAGRPRPAASTPARTSPPRDGSLRAPPRVPGRSAPGPAPEGGRAAGLTGLVLGCLVFAEYFDHVRFMDVAITKLIGGLLLALFLVQPRLWRRPARTFGFVALLVALFACTTAWYVGEIRGQESQAVHAVSVLVQSLILGHISFCLCSVRPRTVREILVAIYLGAATVGLLTAAGLGATEQHAGRLSFFELDENALMMFLGLGIVVGYHFTVATPCGAWRLPVIAFLPIIGWVGMAAGSRGGILGLVAGLLSYTMSSRRLVPTIIAAAAVALGVQLTAAMPFLLDRWEKALYDGDTAGRIDIFEESVAQFLERPWFGRGATNGYVDLGYRLRAEVDIGYHNEILWVLCSTGVVGLVVASLGAMRLAAAVANDPSTSGRSLKTALLVLVFVSAMTVELHHRKIVWVILGLAASVAPAEGAGRGDRRPPGPAVAHA